MMSFTRPEVGLLEQLSLFLIVMLTLCNAYAIVPLQGSRAVKIAVKNPGKVSDSDPMGQRGFVSWKAWQASAILNEIWVARIECCATANPTS